MCPVQVLQEPLYSQKPIMITLNRQKFKMSPSATTNSKTVPFELVSFAAITRVVTQTTIDRLFVHYASIFSSVLVRQKHQALFEHFSGILPKINIFSTEKRTKNYFYEKMHEDLLVSSSPKFNVTIPLSKLRVEYNATTQKVTQENTQTTVWRN